MLCAAMKVWKRTACWLPAQLPAVFTFSASPALHLDQFRVLQKAWFLLAVGVEVLEIISTVSVLSALWAQFAENCFLSRVCIWNVCHCQMFVCHQGSCQPAQNWQWALLPHSALLWMAQLSPSEGPYLKQRLATGLWSTRVTLPTAVSNRMQLGHGGTQRAGMAFWCLTWKMTSRKCAYFQQNP